MRLVSLPRRLFSPTSEAFLDENLSPRHSAELRSDGYDACGAVGAGLSGATDEQILHFAVENGRILVTLDADFANIIRFPPEHTHGVVRPKVDPPTEDSIRQAIRRALLMLRNMDLTGCLAVVDADRVRIRR
jgi:predicted nuclease of predicted toxin-antitoxin system